MAGQEQEVTKLQKTIEDLEDKVRLFEELEKTLKDKATLQVSLMEEKLASQITKNDALVAQVDELKRTVSYLEERLKDADASLTIRAPSIVNM